MDLMTAKPLAKELKSAADMDLIVEKVDVWASPLMDRPGGLADKLEALREAGADLQFIIARRAQEKPGGGVVFVTPLRGDREVAAATAEGFNVTRSLHSLRIEGTDRPGVLAGLLRRLADAGLSLQGLSAAVIGPRFVAYIGLDTGEDAELALRTLQAG